MATFVQKFGGTSVGDVERIGRCAARIKQRVDEGHRVVVVVSAMGHTTDELISLAKEVNDQASRRELDMLMATGEQVSVALLALALQRIGVPATSLTGGQAGIVTDGVYGRARVTKVSRRARTRRRQSARCLRFSRPFQGWRDHHSRPRRFRHNRGRVGRRVASR